MPEREVSIAVVGAAGFVGQELLRQFESDGTAVTAVVRGFPELAIAGKFHRVVNSEAVVPHTFDIVINLAYPTSGAMFEQAAANDAIVQTVENLVRSGGRVIQVSTLAVFGMAVDQPVTVGPITPRRDVTYVESKIAAEQQFLDLAERHRVGLDVVRLGNVWGRASGAWAVPVTQRLLTGRPLGVRGAPGHSNTTDVSNVADYLRFLYRAESPARPRYHHVAEFSDVRWDEWIEPIAKHMGVTPVLADPSVIAAPDGLVPELREALQPLGVRAIYNVLAHERYSGSVLRGAIRRMPPFVQGKLRSDGLVFAAEPSLDRYQQQFLRIMAGEHRFPSHTLSAWTPPVSQDESLARTLAWLDAG